MYYLKYRPQKFSELFGLEEISTSLQKALAKNQVAHAYIFTGPKGSGKTTTARILAKALNCERLAYSGERSVRSDQEKLDAKRSTLDASQVEPCNQCSTCQAINEGRFLDLIEIDAASNRGIDDIRELRDKIKLAPSLGRFKVYIIDEAHMLTHEAFNALLKTLEEPPSHAVFILATTEYHKIPETIKSRCQTLRFRRASREDLVKRLSFICEQERIKIPSEKLLKIADLAEGGYRNAETLLEQLVVGEVELDFPGFKPERWLDLLLQGDAATVLQELGLAIQAGENPNQLARGLVSFLRKLLLLKGGVNGEKLDLTPDEVEHLRTLDQRLNLTDLTFILSRLLEVAEQEKYSPIPQLPLEMAVVDLSEYLLKPSSPSKPTPPAAGDDFSPRVREDQEELSAPPTEPASAAGDVLKVSLDELHRRWPEFLKAVKPLNHSLEALLRSARPAAIEDGGLLTIEVFYKFHKEKLSETRNLSLVQKALAQIFKGNSTVRYVLGERTESPIAKEVSSPGAKDNDQDLVEAALEAFGS